MHAGELETSILLAAYPSYPPDGWNTTDHSAPDRRYLTTLGIGAYTDMGGGPRTVIVWTSGPPVRPFAETLTE